jgi:hypothetical protein
MKHSMLRSQFISGTNISPSFSLINQTYQFLRGLFDFALSSIPRQFNPVITLTYIFRLVPHQRFIYLGLPKSAPR